jgi:predicted nucleotidyltransferase
MINLENTYLMEILSILKQYVPDCEARVFGSRVNGKAQRFSDIDLVLTGTYIMNR